MTEGDLVNIGELVIVETGPPGQTLHAVGRVMAPAEQGSWWLDLNTGGVHLPQMYRLTEVIARSLTPSMIARHGFCLSCLGFGVPADTGTEIGVQPPESSCAECGGTGRNMVTMTVTRDESSTVADVQIDEIAVAEIECEVCRSSLTPTPS